MLKYWPDVLQTVEALFHVVKNMDPDGVEVRVTSDPTKSKKFKGSTGENELLHFIRSNFPASTNRKCMMAKALTDLINDLVPLPNQIPKEGTFGRLMKWRKRANGISIYILTNGVWSGSAAESSISMCNVDDVIRDLVSRLRGSGHIRQYLTTQFIRFGRDKVGKARLKHLDNNIYGQRGTRDWDIVDRRYWEGPMKAMLVGAMDEGEYPSDDSSDEDAAAPDAG